MRDSVRPSRRRLWLAPLVVVAALVTGATPVAAGGPPPGVHLGNYGLHLLADNGEYSGANCQDRDKTGHLRSLTIRRPIVFAYDRTHGKDTQLVKWRYRILGSNDGSAFETVATSNKKAATATDQVNAIFIKRTYTFASLDYVYYSVVVQMFWHYPNAQTVDGRADENVRYYSRSPTSSFVSYCPAIDV